MNIIFEIFYYILKHKNYENFVINVIRKIGEYNIIFVKIFQWIWINNNSRDNLFITEKIENEISSYTNNTPYDENDIDYKNLFNLYLIANKNSDKLEIDNMKPINSGTISLVFKGKLNGKNIAIKILRKNIKEKLQQGINLLVNIENILYYIPIINYYVSTKIFEKNKSNILNQINFINESDNLMLFYKKFKNNKIINIPNCYTNYTISEPNVILMDYIDGNYLYELKYDELDSYFIPFCKFVLTSIFQKKIIHCDLHQGNIIFFKEIYNDKVIYKVGIIDFGMITKLTTNEIDFIYLWLSGVFNNKFEELIDYMKNSNNISNIFDNYENININVCMEEILDLYNSNQIFSQLEKTETLIENVYFFLNKLKQNNCKLSSRYNFFVLSLIPVFSILIKLGPKIEKRNIVKELINKMSNNSLLD